MKFVCDKCNTKYSIADERVRRKVLKIRCKNCSNIIIVREPTRSSSAPRPQERSRSGLRPLESAFDGAFKPRPKRPKRTSSAAHPMPSVQGVPDMASDEFEPEPTRLSDVPDFVDDFAPKEEDEWFLAVDGNQYGPMAISELCSRVKRGEAGDEAYVWRDGFDDWMDVQDVPELRPYVPRHPPPPPRGKSGLYSVSAVAQASPLAPTVPQSSPGLIPPRPASSSFRQVPTRQEPVQVQPAPAPVHPVATPQLGSPAGAVPMPRPQASPVPPTYQELPPVPAPAGPPQGESDLRPLPPLAQPPLGEPLAAPAAPAPAPAPGRTPLWMIIAGIGGGLAALCGVFLVGYSLFIDRTTDNKPDPSEAAANVPQPVQPVPAADATALAQAEPDPEIEFPPMEVERSKKSSRVVHRRAKSTSKAPARPALTAEQKRLMKLYNQSGPSAEAPAAETPRRASSSGFKRAIKPVELFALQRKNKGALKACYERALKRDQTLTELKAEVTVSIGDTGAVRNVKIRAGDNADLVACIKRSIRRWAFPAVGAQTFAFPIIFRGS